MPTKERDLASAELWERSIERSRRRRALADSARKEISRRKTATYAVSAAVAASPMWPGVSSAVNELSGKDVNNLARKLERRDIKRILLKLGDKSPAVRELQRKLQIPDDGVFGPQTLAAVRDFQKRAGLDTSGEVDVKTWLKLFPGDMIVSAPPGAAKALGATASDGPQWAAVSASQPAVASASARRGEHTGSKSSSRSRARDGLVHAASVGAPGLDGVATDQPTSPGGPVTTDPTGTPPGVNAPGTPDQTPAGPPTGGHGGAQAPSGVSPAPQVSPNIPTPGGAGDIIKTLMAAANRIDSKRYAYSWGGGHNAAFSGPYDCSGAVSAVLHAAGLLNRPMVSGEFMRWGAPGPGAVTIYANPGHMYMSILGKFWGTSGSNPGGGAGWFNGSARPGFAVVHVPFERMRLRDVAAERRTKARVRAKKRRAVAKRRAARRQQARAPYRGPSGGAQAGAPAPQQSQPPQDSGSPQPAEAPAPAPVPAPAPPPAPVQASPSPPAQSAPVHSAPAAQSAPAQSAPQQSAPQQSAPVQSAPAHSAPVQSAPAQSAPQQSAPVQSAPKQSTPSEAQAPSAPSTPAAPQAPSASSGAPAASGSQGSAPSTPAPQAPSAPAQSAPAGNSAGAQPSTPPATAPKPSGGDSAGGDSGTAASG